MKTPKCFQDTGKNKKSFTDFFYKFTARGPRGCVCTGARSKTALAPDKKGTVDMKNPVSVQNQRLPDFFAYPFAYP